MAPAREPVCVCIAHRAIALAAAAAHLAAYHNKGAQLIRPQSKGNSLKGRKGGRRERGFEICCVRQSITLSLC